MVKRFFAFLFRDWTDETEYSFEISRMIFITLILLVIPAILFRVYRDQIAIVWTDELLSTLVRYFSTLPFLAGLAFSIVRMVGISKNRKWAIAIKPQTIPKILEAYPGKALFCKINGKYRKIQRVDDVNQNDQILLILIGKRKPLSIHELQKIKKVLDCDDKEEIN